MPLELRGAGVTFGGTLFGGPRKRALAPLDLTVGKAPHILAVVGESGSGKTTLTRLLLGLLRPTTGTASWNGHDVWSLPTSEFRDYRRAVQAVFQDPFGAYNPVYRVDRMLILPALRFGLADSAEAARSLAEATLAGVGLRPAETLGRFPHQLSGGQRQRLMVARAMMLKPTVLIADEPVSMVDASLRATILETLYRLRQESGLSIVYVTHDLATAYQIADSIMVMRNGEVVEQGETVSVIRTPVHAYTGELVAALPPPDPTVDWGLESTS